MTVHSLKKALIFTGTVSVFAMILTLPSLVGAQPGANPPAGNVDATFNSVTVTDGTDDHFFVDSNGLVQNPTGTVEVVDDDGLRVRSTAGNVNTSLDVQGRLTNESGTIYGGVTAIDDADGFGVWPGDSYPGHTSQPGFKVDADGTISHPGLVCGNPPICSFFLNAGVLVDDPQGLIVDSTNGVMVQDGSGNDSLWLRGYGGMEMKKTSTSSFPYGVFNVDVPVGLTVRPLSIGSSNSSPWGSGNLQANARGASGMKSYGGNLVAVGGSLNGGSLHAQRGDTDGNGISDAPAGGDIFVEGSIQNIGPHNAGRVHVADDLTVIGKIRATSGIGTYYDYSYSYTSTCFGGICYRFSSNSCPGGMQLVNCGADSSSWRAPITDVYASGNTCTVSGANTTTATSFTLKTRLKCLDPDA